MKRFLCILAALMLLCGTCGAETIWLQVRCEADAEQMAQYLYVSGASESEKKDNLSIGLAALLSSMTFRLARSENAMREELALQGKTIVDLSTVEAGTGHTIVRSSLFPGYAAEMENDVTYVPSELLQEFNSFDWDDLWQDLSATFDTWWQGTAKTVEKGVFVGDAFAGGVSRRVANISDRDAAVLLNALLDDVSGTLQMLELAELNPAQIIEDARKQIRQMAMENRARMTVAEVFDANDSTVGLSFILYYDDVQVMTLSLGMTEKNGLRAVIGAGLDEAVWYADLSLDLKTYALTEEAAAEDQADLLFKAAIYEDPERMGFARAASQPAALSYSCAVRSAQPSDTSAETTIEEKVATPRGSISATTVETQLASLDKQEGMTVTTVRVNDSETPCMTWYTGLNIDNSELVIEGEQDKVIPFDDAANDPDFQAALQQGQAVLRTNLIKYVPAELMVFIMNLL